MRIYSNYVECKVQFVLSNINEDYSIYSNYVECKGITTSISKEQKQVYIVTM